MIKRYRLILSGKVQGVGLRWRTLRYARRYNLGGWIENQPGGSVILEAEGEELKLNGLMQWLKQAPDYIKIERLDWQEIAPQQEKKFIIKYHKLWWKLFF